MYLTKIWFSPPSSTTLNLSSNLHIEIFLIGRYGYYLILGGYYQKCTMFFTNVKIYSSKSDSQESNLIRVIPHGKTQFT